MPSYIGCGGVPISSTERSTIGGIKHCAKLGLTAMEVEFVRGVNMKPALATEVGKVAKEFNVKLSVHAPYYINLLSDNKEIVKSSIQRIIDALDRAERMGADAVAVHAAFFGKLTRDDAMKQMFERTEEIISRMEKLGVKNAKLGYETMAKNGQWGLLSEIIEVHKKFRKQVIPYLDWGHMFARNGGKINFAEVLDEMEKLNLKHINSHFNCVKFSTSSKAWVDIHEPVATKNPDFEQLAKELVKRKTNITLICETPLLEKDALEMKKIIEEQSHKF